MASSTIKKPIGNNVETGTGTNGTDSHYNNETSSVSYTKTGNVVIIGYTINISTASGDNNYYPIATLPFKVTNTYSIRQVYWASDDFLMLQIVTSGNNTVLQARPKKTGQIIGAISVITTP